MEPKKEEGTLDVDRESGKIVDTRVLTPEEEALAEKHGFVEKKQESEPNKEESDLKKEESEPKKKESKPEEKEPEHSSDLDEKFEKMSESPEHEHEELTKFDKSKQSFYWKWKKDKVKRQDIEAKYELQQLKLAELEKRIEDKTRDPLDELIKEDEEKKPLTKKEYEDDKRKAEERAEFEKSVKVRMARDNNEARNKYEDYDDVVKLAAEVMRNDTEGIYYETFLRAAESPKGNSAEVAYRIGKLHPNYGKKKAEDSANGKEKETIEKIKENAQKGIPSSSIPESRSSNNVVPENELTAADCSSMNEKQWMKLSRETRTRILKESCA